MKRLDKNLNLSSITISIVIFWLLSIITYIVVYQDKIFIAILSSLGTLFAQRYIENLKNEKKQQELARLIINWIGNSVELFLSLQTHVIPSSRYSTETKSFIILELADEIKPDETYNWIKKNIGILPLNILKNFSAYNLTFKLIMRFLEKEYPQSLEQRLDDPIVQKSWTYLIIRSAIQGRIVTMLLSKQIVNENSQFEADKDFLVDEYWKAKDTIKNGQDYNLIVDSIEAVFKELRLSDELQVRPLLENQQDTKTSSTEKP